MLTHEEILDELRRAVAKGLVQKDLATELGIAPSRVSEVLKGTRRIQPREMSILVRYLGLEEELHSSVRKIKRIGMVPAGDLREALAEASGTLEVPSDLPKGVFALEVDGESMNKIAPFGCDVVVDPNDRDLFADDLYVLSNEAGEFTFKKFKQDPARLVPLSSDPSHREIMIGTDPLNVVGRVLRVVIGPDQIRRMA